MVGRRSAKFREVESRVIARRVLSGLEYLHSLDCVHRDPKLENLMLKRRGALATTTIVDFG